MVMHVTLLYQHHTQQQLITKLLSNFIKFSASLTATIVCLTLKLQILISRHALHNTDYAFLTTQY